MKEIIKENFKYLILLLMVIVAAISYFVVENNKLAYKEKVRQEELQERDKQKSRLAECLLQAQKDKNDYWNDTCKDMGRKKDCWLPAYNADSIEKSFDKDRKECMEKFKNKAFEPTIDEVLAELEKEKEEKIIWNKIKNLFKKINH